MKVLVDKEFLEDGLELICDSIRLKTGGTGVLAFPVEMKAAVDSIQTGSGGIVPTGAKEITANGTYDVTTFAEAEVAVPIPAGPSGKLEITANGEGIDVAQYAEVDVAVPVGIVPAGELPITANGIYDVTNYASAEVNVPTGGYDEVVYGASGRKVTANTNKSISIVIPIAKEEELGGIILEGNDASTSWVIFSLILMRDDTSGWRAHGWANTANGNRPVLFQPTVTVSSAADGIFNKYTIQIARTDQSYFVFSTAAENYNAIAIRMRKS